jgi:hypothetical protein
MIKIYALQPQGFSFSEVQYVYHGYNRLVPTLPRLKLFLPVSDYTCVCMRASIFTWFIKRQHLYPEVHDIKWRDYQLIIIGMKVEESGYCQF